MTDLHLHVKAERFEAIKRGEKNEEYRLCNQTEEIIYKTNSCL